MVTLFFHGLIMAVILIDAPSAVPQIRRAATEYIRAELVTLDKPKPKPKAAAKPEPKSKPKPKPKAAPKVDEAAKQRALAEQAQQRRALKEEQRLAEEQLYEAQQAQQREAEAELASAIALETAEQESVSDAQLASTYIALITDRIKNNWNRPPSARNNMQTELALRLVPTGEVVSVRVVKSSGNPAFDRSAESAVLKAGRFPELQQLPARVFEQNFRRLTLMFRPEDLRL